MQTAHLFHYMLYSYIKTLFWDKTKKENIAKIYISEKVIHAAIFLTNKK